MDLDGPEPGAVCAVVMAGGDSQPLPLAAGPEPDQHGVGPGGRGHQWHVHLVAIADVFARQPVCRREGSPDRRVITDQPRLARGVEMGEDLESARRTGVDPEIKGEGYLSGAA